MDTAHSLAWVRVRSDSSRHPLGAARPSRQFLADGRDREAAAMSTWALVLAAGEGSRLRALTTSNGVAVPKQFCSLHDGPSLLQEALHRAEAVAPRLRICTIVAAQHRRWWQGPLWSLPSQNIIVQPE